VVVVERFAAVERIVRSGRVRTQGVPAGLAVLEDARVRMVFSDVWDALAPRDDASSFDAVLLDVDNGPGWASFRANARLYTPAGLAEARAALRPGGALAVWSGYPADAFVGQLRRAGFAPEVVPLRERGVVRARAYVGRVPRLG
jgi:spermidine synthase